MAGEASKFGFSPTAIHSQMEEILAFDRLNVVGLMGMAPFAPEAEHSRPYFALLRELRGQLQNEAGIGLPYLSMGMSGDYLVAIEEGATLVRVGSAIFGARAGKKWSPGERGRLTGCPKRRGPRPRNSDRTHARAASRSGENAFELARLECFEDFADPRAGLQTGG